MEARLSLVACILLVACSPEDPAAEVPTRPVVIYAAAEYESTFKALFDQYGRETGTIVIVRYGDSGGLVDDVIRNDISPPADVLLTSTVMEIWRAAEDGALRPINSRVADEAIPAWAKDPDSLWLGLGFDAAVIVSAGIDPPGNYAGLADDRFAGHLCLSSSAISINQAVIAMLIDTLGIRQTELAVRGWVRNLALPPFDTEEMLAGALREGQCKSAIVSAGVAETSGLAGQAPAATYGDVDAIGIARHAQNPEAATLLVEWLIEHYAKQRFADAQHTSASNVGGAAWNYEDAAKLTERAGYKYWIRRN
jgi:iron(III) transport system substrate-binding protein